MFTQLAAVLPAADTCAQSAATCLRRAAACLRRPKYNCSGPNPYTGTRLLLSTHTERSLHASFQVRPESAASAAAHLRLLPPYLQSHPPQRSKRAPTGATGHQRNRHSCFQAASERFKRSGALDTTPATPGNCSASLSAASSSTKPTNAGLPRRAAACATPSYVMSFMHQVAGREGMKALPFSGAL